MATANAVDCRLLGTDGTGTFIVEPSEVLYAETVDGRTFLYGRDRVLESPLRLYELEEALAGTEFVRASKSLIVNFDHVRALRPYLNARLELVLSNGESVIASRQYAPAMLCAKQYGSGFSAPLGGKYLPQPQRQKELQVRDIGRKHLRPGAQAAAHAAGAEIVIIKRLFHAGLL